MTSNIDSKHSLEKNPVHLGKGGTALVEPDLKLELAWYMDYAQRHDEEDGLDGRLMSMYTFTEDYKDVWEMHPVGSEVVLCISGQLMLIQKYDMDGNNDDAGTTTKEEKVIVLHPGEYAINPPGVWHTTNVVGTTKVLMITAGKDTQVRARN
jgi:hypothetical protein